MTVDLSEAAMRCELSKFAIHTVYDTSERRRNVAQVRRLAQEIDAASHPKKSWMDATIF
jgi:hypothetical protein